MSYARLGARTCILAIALIVFAVTALLPVTLRAQAAVGKTHSPTWSKDLEGWAQRASVSFGNIDGDADQEIFIGTNAGKVYGFNNDGSPLDGWPVNVIGSVASAPAIGDITGDGVAEVVITAGGLVNGGNLTGGIWAFRPNGQLLWRKVTQTMNGTVAPGIFASPVLADLDSNGTLDVITASYDENVYALKGDGTPVFPNALPAAAGARNGALIWLGDSSWATPAVGDVDGDGVVDIVVTSATNIDARFSYIYGPGWNDQAVANACSKVPQNLGAIDRSQKRACGLVAVFSNQGQLKPGWPQFIPGHTYDASPALANLDGDAQLEIVTGNGWDPTFGDASQPFYVTAWNHNGSIFQRYNIDAVVFESGPAIGDITGDGKPEIVVGTNPFDGVNRANTNKIFAFDSSLNVLPGFPVEARDAQFNKVSSATVISLGDVNDDGAADIVFGSTWDVRALNGSGQYLNSALALHGTGPFSGQPAIGNIDGDSNLELVFAAARGLNPGVVHKFDLNVSATAQELPWAQFHGGPFHTGLFAQPDLRVTNLIGAITAGQSRQLAIPINDTVGGSLNWSATASDNWIKLDNNSGRAGQDALRVTLDSGAPFNNGVATGTITVSSGSIVKTIDVRLVQVGEIRSRIFLPITR